MSNVIKISKLFAKVPVRNLGEGINITAFSSISIKGQRWALKHKGETFPFTREDDNSPLTYLDVVILDTNPHTSKLYFGDGPYNEDTASGPICASLKGDVPDPGVSMPQSRACANCPHNAWGSGSSGRGKACSDNRRLAVMLMPPMTRKMFGGTPLLDPVFMKIPPASLRTCKAYGDFLEQQGFPFPGVVTRMSFNPKKQFEILFELREGLSDKAAAHVIPMIKDTVTQQIIGLTSTALSAPTVEEEETATPEPSGSDELLSAFGDKPSPPETNGTTKRSRGRPPGSPNKPKQLELQANKEPEIGPPAEAQQSGNWEDSDTNIDSEVNRLLRQKAADMM